LRYSYWNIGTYYGAKMLKTDTLLPKYRLLYDVLRRRVQSEWSPGDLIPTEGELSAAYDVSRNTVRNAVQLLVHEGHLRKEQGRGTFVTAGAPLRQSAVRSGLRVGTCIQRQYAAGEHSWFVRGVLNTLNPWEQTLEMFPFEMGIDQHEFVMNIVKRGWCDGLVLWPMGSFTKPILDNTNSLEFHVVSIQMVSPLHDKLTTPLTVEVALDTVVCAIERIPDSYRSITLLIDYPKKSSYKPFIMQLAEQLWKGRTAAPEIKVLALRPGFKDIASIKAAVEMSPGPNALVVESPNLVSLVGCYIDSLAEWDPKELGVLQVGLAREGIMDGERFSRIATPLEQVGATATKLLLDRLQGLVTSKCIAMKDIWTDRGSLNVRMDNVL